MADDIRSEFENDFDEWCKKQAQKLESLSCECCPFDKNHTDIEKCRVEFALMKLQEQKQKHEKENKEWQKLSKKYANIMLEVGIRHELNIKELKQKYADRGQGYN